MPNVIKEGADQPKQALLKMIALHLTVSQASMTSSHGVACLLQPYRHTFPYTCVWITEHNQKSIQKHTFGVLKRTF